MKFWQRIEQSSIPGTLFPEPPVSRSRPFLTWGSLGAALLGILFARWTWLLFAPAAAIMPPAVGEASEDNGQVFGTVHQSTAAPALTLNNIELIGIFANPTKGFAVLRIDDKQRGVPLGGEVRPGLRLAETHPTYVILDQGGVRSRLDLAAASAPAAAAPGALTVPGPPGPSADALQHQLDSADGNMSAQQRAMLQQQIDRLRGKSQ